MARPRRARRARPDRRARRRRSAASPPDPGELTVVVSARPRGVGRGWPTGSAATCRPTPSRSARSIEEELKGRAARRARSERARRRAEIAARDAERTRGPWGVRLGGVDLADATLADVRAHDPGQRHRQPALRRHPAGRRRPARPAHPRAGRAWPCSPPTPRTSTTRSPAAGRASSTSAAAASPAASGSGSCWPARSAPTPPVLVLVEPTSAVDAHTEARIAERVAGLRARPDDRRLHGLAAVAPPRRPRGAARRRPGRGRGPPRGPARRRRRPTAPSSPAPWTRRCRA